jgi:hypothetical protein
MYNAKHIISFTDYNLIKKTDFVGHTSSMTNSTHQDVATDGAHDGILVTLEAEIMNNLHKQKIKLHQTTNRRRQPQYTLIHAAISAPIKKFVERIFQLVKADFLNGKTSNLST